MKKIFLVAFCFTLPLFIFSQETIEFNFNTKNFNVKKYPHKIKYRESIHLEIININPFIYDINISCDENSFHSKPPKLFETYLMNIPELESLEQKDDRGAVKKAETKQDLIKQFKESINFLEQTKVLYQKLQLLIVSNNLPDDIVKYKKDLISDFSDKIDTSKYCSLVIYEECITRLNKVNENYNMLLDSIKDPNDPQLEKSHNIKKKIDSFDYEKLFQDLVQLYDGISKDIFTAYSPFITGRSDEIVFNVKITPKEKYKDSYLYNELSFDVPVEVIKLFNLDFSTGIFISNVLDYEYSIKDNSIVNPSDTTFNIIEEKLGNYTLGLNALMHGTFRIDRDFYIGVNVGIGIDNNQSIKYLTGISFVLGKEQRFVINGGAAFGKVERLDGSLSTSDAYITTPKVETLKENDWGYYFSISYNISSKN